MTNESRNDLPIGVFDSGVGGLTVLHAIQELLPNENLVWKDTAIVPVGSTVDFLVEMTNPGEWMAHCHIAEHLHSGMMFSFVVEETR